MTNKKGFAVYDVKSPLQSRLQTPADYCGAQREGAANAVAAGALTVIENSTSVKLLLFLDATTPCRKRRLHCRLTGVFLSRREHFAPGTGFAAQRTNLPSLPKAVPRAPAP